MKKLTTLLLAAGLVVSSFAGAQAGEFKPNLQFAEEFTYGDSGKDSPENFNAASRIRFGFDYVASEDLSATILFQYRHAWGTDTKGDFTADPTMNEGDGANHFRMRLAYIDWTIPGTDIKARMGRHALVAPSYAFGSPILNGRGDGITLASAINDNINVGFTWARLDSSDANGESFDSEDDADAVMLNAEFAYDGFKVAPWVMYAHADKEGLETVKPAGSILFGRGDYKKVGGKDVFEKGYAADAFVIGASAELSMFDPFVFALDALYSNAKLHNMDPAAEDSFDGFYVAAKASYKFDNGTASFGGWYSTGNDEDAKNDNGFVMLDPGFAASTILFGDNIIGVDGYNTLFNNDSPFGTWGLIAEYAGFSFLENLSHTARVVYVQGTNDKDAERDLFMTPTEDDSFVEVDFNSTYQIYKNFSATLELGYVFIDQSNLDGADEQDDIFRSALTFVYKF